MSDTITTSQAPAPADRPRSHPGPLFYEFVATSDPQLQQEQLLPHVARRHRRAHLLSASIRGSHFFFVPLRGPSWNYETNPFPSRPPSRLRGSRKARPDETNPNHPPPSIRRFVHSRPPPCLSTLQPVRN